MSTDFPNAWPNYPCDDNTPDMCDEIIAEATAEVLADLVEILQEGIKLNEACRDSVRNHIPTNGWDDLLDVGDLAEEVENEVTDAIHWAQKNGKL